MKLDKTRQNHKYMIYLPISTKVFLLLQHKSYKTGQLQLLLIMLSQHKDTVYFRMLKFSLQHSYKMWTCSTQFSFYQGDTEIPPCGDICTNVQNRCPFFRPSSNTVHAGEPSFLCKGMYNVMIQNTSK